MKFILTAIIASIAFIGISQTPNWDQRFEKAKFEQREGISETYTQDILKTSGAFTRDDLFTVEESLEENPYVFKIELVQATGAMRFYHKSNTDGDYLMEQLKISTGYLDLELGEMSKFDFE